MKINKCIKCRKNITESKEIMFSNKDFNLFCHENCLQKLKKQQEKIETGDIAFSKFSEEIVETISKREKINFENLNISQKEAFVSILKSGELINEEFERMIKLQSIIKQLDSDLANFYLSIYVILAAQLENIINIFFMLYWNDFLQVTEKDFKTNEHLKRVNYKMYKDNKSKWQNGDLRFSNHDIIQFFYFLEENLNRNLGLFEKSEDRKGIWDSLKRISAKRNLIHGATTYPKLETFISRNNNNLSHNEIKRHKHTIKWLNKKMHQKIENLKEICEIDFSFKKSKHE